MLRKFLAALTTAAVLLTGTAQAHPGHDEDLPRPPWAGATVWPDRIVITFAADPARTLAVSWRTDGKVTATKAEIALATPDARFDLAARTVAATTETVDLARVPMADAFFDIADNAGLSPVSYHSVLFEGLKPDTLYAYRVMGANGAWSEWFQTRTAPLEGPISFIYLGDAQNGILTHWARTIRAAYAEAPDARFILHAGDLVDRGSRDYEWAQWFRASSHIHGMIPAVPVAGNHEYMRVGPDPATAQRMLSMLWRPQFRLPVVAELPESLRETVYDVRYSADLHVFVLDTQGGNLEAQAAWLDKGLAASTATWKVVSFHHPVFSSGNDRDDPARRAILLPVLERRNVDLVLQGHDHTYARGVLQPDTAAQTPERRARRGGSGDVGPMFVNSVSGPKQYKWRETGWDDYQATNGVKLERRAANTQFFQVVRIDGRKLEYRALTADGQLYDAYVMEKRADGRRRMLKGPRSTMPERTMENTMPYPGTDGLND
jgi:3',5'-cyclic AMP phosphodiesterase CpdA